MRDRFVRRINGLTVLLGFLVCGIGVLGGGYVWVLNGSLNLGILVGGGISAAVGWFLRVLARRHKGFRFVGEVHPGVVEEDFTDLVDEEDSPPSRLARQGQQRPEQVADSIRYMMVKGQERRRR